MNRTMIVKVVVSVFVGFILYFLAVNFNDSFDPTSYFRTDQECCIETPLSKDAAIKIAQKEVAYRVTFSPNSRWKSLSKVVGAFPIFMDGIEGVSYYECKVMTGGLHAGYILVNVNQTDLLISESAEEGITLTERYGKTLGRDDFMVLRYDWFRSAAVEKKQGLSNSHGKILALIGFEGIADPENAMNKFRAFVLSKGCFPSYSKDEIQQYYKGLQDDLADGYTIDWGKNAWAAGDYRNISAELKHKCWCNKNNECYHTPRWSQFRKSNGHAIGCGNTAWAIVYGYWAKCKNYNRLFDGDLSNYEKIRQCMSDCARYCDTRDVYEKTKKFGYTPPGNMADGIKYAKNKGYGNSTCKRLQKISEFNKFDAIHPYIKADKPCILMLNESGFGFPNHFVVIEKATKRQKRVLKKWRDRDVFFTVNIGWGGDSREIWTRETGRNDHKHYSTFDAYLIDIK